MRRLQKTIFEIGWTRTVPRFVEADPVAAARDVMSRDAHDCVLLIGSDGKLVGIFTGRDFLNRVAAERIDPRNITLGKVMSPKPRALHPRDPVAFAINWMSIEGFRNVPIVDDDGYPLGVLTVFDLMRALSAIFDNIDETPRENLQTVSSISKVFDIGGDS
jgi:CBS domain-containing protein